MIKSGEETCTCRTSRTGAARPTATDAPDQPLDHPFRDATTRR